MYRRRPRAMLVDGDPLVRFAVDRQLDALGWEALSVGSGEETIWVVELGFVIDVMVTDLTLPDLDGLSVAWAVTRLSLRTGVVFIAAAPPTEQRAPYEALYCSSRFPPRRWTLR